VTGWRDVLAIHPAAEQFPLMAPDELKELGEDIAKNGLRQPVVFWIDSDTSKPMLLDGRTWLDAMEAAGQTLTDGKAGLDLKPRQFVVVNNVDPVDYVVSANILRRHLLPEKKRELIAGS
jgi:hypothetical protein